MFEKYDQICGMIYEHILEVNHDFDRNCSRPIRGAIYDTYSVENVYFKPFE